MKVALLPILFATALPTLASAQLPDSLGEATNPANGHVYHILEESTWTDAQAAAVAMGGNLVTIDDQAENDWVYQTFGNWGNQSRDLWIGLHDINTEGVHEWASGATVSFTNWAIGQPDNYTGNDPINGEDHVHMYGFNSPYYPGEWNDMHDAAPGTAGWNFGLYGIVELEGASYSIDQLVAGQVSTLSFRNFTPSANILLGVSVNGPGPTQTIFGDVAMTPPIITLPLIPADANGNATQRVRIKPYLQGVTVYSQAVDLSSFELSNAIAQTVL
ncbi:MAG: hypothetical protein CMJ94_06975 [Planctomycetes bacterium]|nr:hypothetical protein [Planctomycetota bacterium]